METRKKKSFKRLFAFLMAFVMVTTLAVSAVFAAPTFSDVPETHEFYDFIEDLAGKDVVGGYGSTGLYKPEEKITRAQTAKMVAKAALLEYSEDFVTSFLDVPISMDLAEEIWALEEAEIVKGFGGTKLYKPAEYITRGHVAVILQRAFKLSKGSTVISFTDLPDDPEIKEAIEILASNGIVKGFGDTGLFKPDEYVTRGQFAKMVSGALEKALEIVEVKAVAQTIPQGEPTDLKFLVNGKEETKATFDAWYGVDGWLDTDGYTIAFFYDSSLGGNYTNGEVNASADFKYAVQVTEPGATPVKTPAALVAADYAKVTVKDMAAWKVTAAELDGDVSYVTAGETERTFVATAGIDGLGNALTEDELDTLNATRAHSSNLAVASFESGEIVAKSKGTATFDVFFTPGSTSELADSVKVTVEVKAKQVETSLDAPKQTIAKGGSGVDKEKIDILDQYGVKMGSADETDYVSGDLALSYAVTKSGSTTAVSFANIQDAEGNYTVKVSIGTPAKVLGSFSVEVVDIGNAKPDTYWLEFSKDDEDKDLDTLDIKDDGSNVLLTLKASYKGVEMDPPYSGYGHSFEASVSDEDAYKNEVDSNKITVSFEDVDKAKVGSMVLTVQVKQEDYPIVTLTKTIKVVSTYDQIVKLELVPPAKTLTKVVANEAALVETDVVTGFTKDDAIAELTAKDGTGKVIELKAGYIAGVAFENRTYDATNKTVKGTVTITLEAKYGGLTKSFAGEVSLAP